jgi:hypothetical protein
VTLTRRLNLLLVIGVAKNGEETNSGLEKEKPSQKIYTFNSGAESTSQSCGQTSGPTVA